jgi:glutamate-ammonia-ligase adenylyltransferase
MIDELLDSLVLNQPRRREDLAGELAELCRGATDLEPILHSFQDKELLRIGVRDVLHKDSIQETTTALSDVAETILSQVAGPQEKPLRKRFGTPLLEEGPRAGGPCRFVILALGKLGAREMNYHSDLDLMMLYEGDGRTGPREGASRHERFEQTDNFHYFSELAQRIIKALSQLGPMGRLYTVDMRLRPTGKSGSLVLPLCELRRYFMGGTGSAAHPEGGAQLWERQALTRARVVYGDGEFAAAVREAVVEAAFTQPWKPEQVDEVRDMRARLEASRPVRDLKRGPGGLADVEFLVQMLQLAHGRDLPSLRVSNTWHALASLRAAGLLDPEEHAALKASYDFLLRVQSQLRIVHNRTLDTVPESPEEVEKLARRLGFESGGKLLAELDQHRTRTRELYGRLMERERGETPGAPEHDP